MTLTTLEIRTNFVALAGTWNNMVKADRKLSEKTSDQFKAGLAAIGKREDGKNWGMDGFFLALHSGDKNLIAETLATILNADKKDPDSDAGTVKNRWASMLCSLQSTKVPPVKQDELVVIMASLQRLLSSDRREQTTDALNVVLKAVEMIETEDTADFDGIESLTK